MTDSKNTSWSFKLQYYQHIDNYSLRNVIFSVALKFGLLPDRGQTPVVPRYATSPHLLACLAFPHLQSHHKGTEGPGVPAFVIT